MEELPPTRSWTLGLSEQCSTLRANHALPRSAARMNFRTAVCAELDPMEYVKGGGGGGGCWVGGGGCGADILAELMHSVGTRSHPSSPRTTPRRRDHSPEFLKGFPHFLRKPLSPLSRRKHFYSRFPKCACDRRTCTTERTLTTRACSNGLMRPPSCQNSDIRYYLDMLRGSVGRKQKTCQSKKHRHLFEEALPRLDDPRALIFSDRDKFGRVVSFISLRSSLLLPLFSCQLLHFS